MKVTRVLGLALVLLATACSDNTSSPASGRTQVLLTDSPFPYDRIAHVNMYVERIEVSATADTIGAGDWQTVATPARAIDLLQLQAGQTTLLGETDVDPSTVGAVRVVINTAQSTVIDNAGHAVVVHWPVSGELTLNAYVQQSLAQFAPGTAHHLVIDFDVGRSFEDLSGNGDLTFIPWIRALDDAGAGVIAGTVRGRPDSTGPLVPLENAAVTVLAGNPALAPTTWWKIATGKTDASGHYRVAFILLGQYIVRVEPLGQVAVGCADEPNVQVVNGQTTTLDVDLPLEPGTCARQTSGGGGPDTTGTGQLPDTTGTDTTGTGGDTTTVGGAVASVVVTGWPQNPAVGDSVGLFANLANAQGASLYGRAVTWAVSDTSVLSITGTYGQSLILKARQAGSATVSATSEGVAGNLMVTVH